MGGEWIGRVLRCPGFRRSAYKAGYKSTGPLVAGGVALAWWGRLGLKLDEKVSKLISFCRLRWPG